ncbi:hypothetical protein CFIMG_007330RA00001 [Ceratocystis fimbriata CBS 114723]|uniref:RING-type domain-containing protein n=1 Tax=Ceratocystis fimbriata CBS 114723 TaxID=1035309 RepID=A0A2C5WX87_9PEZI|nr:hypothetical protein CFIMG_007330RA00001 [Ceratocystis fimbriata CBS 114723]
MFWLPSTHKNANVELTNLMMSMPPQTSTSVAGSNMAMEIDLPPGKDVNTGSDSDAPINYIIDYTTGETLDKAPRSPTSTTVSSQTLTNNSTFESPCPHPAAFASQLPSAEFDPPPARTLQSVRDIFSVLMQGALDLGLSQVAEGGGVHVRVATLCSGTDAPVFALRELQEAAAALGYGNVVSFEHIFSAEIETFKQAFIRRNVKPHGPVFRDVQEMAKYDKAMNAEGFLEEVDHDVDILVFGSSCVDFSNLNNSKKALGKGALVDITKADYTEDEPEVQDFLESILDCVDGESSRTFLSGLLYISKYRPCVVIMENVINAPWEQISNFWFAKVGYVARYRKCSSKDYGMPHIRMRGYLVAVDYREFGEDSERPSDDRLLQHRTALKKTAKSLRINDARMCQLRHAEARAQEGLPLGSRYTMMDHRSHCMPREDSFQESIIGLGEREKDLLDITYERGLQKQYDMNHKLLIYDISQNVDRAPGQLGWTPCLTPKGNPFVTNQGRPLLGIEALSLQGIDIDRVVPSIETQMQLQDLAGNAMTTTVVGAALLSAIISIEGLWQKCFSRPARHYVNTLLDETRNERTPVIYQDSNITDLATTTQRRPDQLDSMSPEHLMTLFEDCRSYCPCESASVRRRSPSLLQCATCREIRCKSCAGNPRHHMFPKSTIKFEIREKHVAIELVRRLANHAFVLCDEDSLPGDLSVVTEPYLAIPSLEDMALDGVSWDPDLERVMALCRSKVRLIFEKVHVGQVLTIFYQSVDVYLHVVIEGKTIRWLVFVKASSWIAREYDHLHDWSRPFLMAEVDLRCQRGVPEPHNWRFWLKDEIKATLSITGLRDGHYKLAFEEAQWFNSGKWKAVIRFHPFWARFVRLAQGEYSYSDECGVSRGRIIAKHSDNMASVFIFEDPGLVSAPEDDRWVIAWTNRRLHTFEVRDVLATLSSFPSVDAMPLNDGFDTAKVDVFVKGWWVGVPNPKPDPKKPVLSLRRQTSRRYSDRTSPFGGVLIHSKVFQPVVTKVRGTYSDMLSCQPTPFVTVRVAVDKLHWPNDLFPMLMRPGSLAFRIGVDQDGWLTLPQRLHTDAMQLIYHNFKAITEESLANCLENGAGGIGMTRAGLELCPVCTPPIPHVHGVVNPDGKIVDLISDQEECRHFEDCIRARPCPLQIQVRIVPGTLIDDEQQKSHIEVRVNLNIETLVHRASGYLPRPAYALSQPRGREGEVHIRADIETWYEEDDLWGRAPFIEEVWPTTAETSDADVTSMTQPPSFVYNGKFLRTDQMISLGWMLGARNNNVKPFRECEIEECMVPGLNMRLIGEVGRDNYVRGGVLAHEVGYGKTVVALAMLDYTREHNSQSLRDRSELIPDGIIHLKASLIIVPHHLIKQWCSEIESFLQNSTQPWKVVVISSKRDAMHLNRAELQKADIIVASFRAIQLGQARLDTLAVVGGQLRINEKESGRKLSNWYDAVISWIRPSRQDESRSKHEKSNKNSRRDYTAIDSLTKQHFQHTLSAVRQAQKTQVPHSSRRSTTANKKQGSGNVTKLDQSWRRSIEKPSKLWRDGSLLELYSFSSIVYDEFSYNEEHIALFFRHALATAKWILSGTPPLAHLGQICDMAGLLNVHVAREEPAIPPHMPKITQGPSTKDMSQAERFRSYRQLKSSAFVAERDEQARRFIHTFIRRNFAVQGKYSLVELVVPVTMNSVSSLLYHVAQQTLFDAKWVFDDVQGDIREMINGISAPQVDRQGRPVPLSTKKYLTVAAEALMAYASGRATEMMRAMHTPAVKLEVGTNESQGQGQDRYNVQSLLHQLYNKQLMQVKLLCKLLKSQWDRMMYLSERLEKDPTFNMKTGSATDPRKAKQSSAIKLRDSVVHSLFRSESASEIQILLRQMVFGNKEPQPEILARLMDDRPVFAGCKWAAHEGGPAAFSVFDWYPQVDEALNDMDTTSSERAAIIGAALWAMKDPESAATPEAARQVQSEIADFVGTQLDSFSHESTLLLLENVRNRQDLFESTDQTEIDCGFTGPNIRQFHYCRTTGLKCTQHDTKTQLEAKLARFAAGEAREADFEFQGVLPHFHPHYGQIKTTRGASIDAGLDDFILTVQSLERGIKNHFVPAFQRYRLLRLCINLTHGSPLKCDVCERRLPLEAKHRDEIFCLVTCGHAYCKHCASGFRVDEDYHCRVPTCRCASRGSLIDAKSLLPLDCYADSEASAIETSSKVTKVVTLASEIVQRGDSVLIFVQFDYLKDDIAAALTAAKIPYGRTDGQDGPDQLVAFQAGRFSVLLQSLMSTESAGSNLTIANHIIFAAPLMTDKYS